MPEIIDLLTTKIDEGAQFVVNVAVDSVPLTAVTGNNEIMEAGGGTSLFARGDNFLLLSCGYIMPENFILAQYDNTVAAKYPVPIMYYAGRKFLGGDISFFNIGNNGLLRMPFADYELSNGVFVIPEDNNLVENFYFTVLFPFTSGIDRPQVSMINAPTDLDGETMYVQPFVKILHNLPLT